MKLLESIAKVEQIGNITEENQFRMKTSRKAFQILSDLYSDKPLAIVRELGCNAFDSHVAAGISKKPFHIHLPNSLEPWLVIQDFGTGISHSDIYDVYATYFESTKTNNNNQVGCLGLGSKSPFCYSDNFMVTSIFEGVKRTYNAYFNTSNTPSIALMHTENTNECNGVSVQIPVKEKDFLIFSNAVKKAFRFFDIKPDITGANIEWNMEKPIFSSEGWSSYDSFSYGECYAIMGGITYPVEYIKLNPIYINLGSRAGLVMKFEIGELDFTPSRESLSYDDATISALNNKMAAITESFMKDTIKMLEEKENIFEALKAFNFLKEKYYFINGVIAESGLITWKGINISNPLNFISKLSMKYGSFTVNSYSNRGKTKYKKSITIDYNLDWYIDDLETGTASRVRYYTKNTKSIVVFSSELVSGMLSEGFPDIFLKTSDLAKPINNRVYYKTTNPTTGKKQKGFKIYTSGDYWVDRWVSSQFDPVDCPKYYIVKNPLNYSVNMDIKGFNPVRDKKELVNLLTALGISDSDVCMVSQNNEKRIKEHCKCLKEHIESKYDLSKINRDDMLTYETLYDKCLSISTEDMFLSLPVTNTFYKLIKYVVNLHEVYGPIKRYVSYISYTGENTIKKIKGTSEAMKLVISQIKTGSPFRRKDLITLALSIKK